LDHLQAKKFGYQSRGFDAERGCPSTKLKLLIVTPGRLLNAAKEICCVSTTLSKIIFSASTRTVGELMVHVKFELCRAYVMKEVKLGKIGDGKDGEESREYMVIPSLVCNRQRRARFIVRNADVRGSTYWWENNGANILPIPVDINWIRECNQCVKGTSVENGSLKG
jgi:hypothetical protein